MSTTVTDETLRLSRLALYQLRQDVGIPDSVEEAETDITTTWVKCREYFDIAFEEVLAAHNWMWKREAAETESVLDRPDDWPSDVKNALVYCLARELAVPVAGRVEDMKNCHRLYQQKLQQARIHDLEAELDAVTDADKKEILAAICPTILSSEGKLPMDLISVTRRIDATAAAARAEVISAHNWSFAREEVATDSALITDCDTLYPFATDIPYKCVRPVECYGRYGRAEDWKVVGRVIRSAGPVQSIIFIKDVTDLDKWPPLCRAAYTALIAAEIATMVAGSSGEANRLRQIYERTLENAKVADSRGTGSKREVFGPNYFAEAMLGRFGGHDERRGGGVWR